MLESASNLFHEMQHPNYWISESRIEDTFVLSLMTVVDEVEKPNCFSKYKHLYYVEFLEMICRIGLVCIKIEDLIEYKVELLLEIMYNE